MVCIFFLLTQSTLWYDLCNMISTHELHFVLNFNMTYTLFYILSSNLPLIIHDCCPTTFILVVCVVIHTCFHSITTFLTLAVTYTCCITQHTTLLSLHPHTLIVLLCHLALLSLHTHTHLLYHLALNLVVPTVTHTYKIQTHTLTFVVPLSHIQ